MDTGITADNFYVNAQEIIKAKSYDQDLEDDIDLLMRTESDLLEESEIDILLDEEDVVQMDLQTEVTPSEFTEFAIKIPVGGEIVPFSFDGRRYLRPIYDSPARGILMKCARQTEKCDCEDEKVLTPSGAWITVGDMEIGDEIISLEALSPEEERDGLEVGACRFMATSWRFDRDRVVDKKCVGKHEAVKLTSRMGSEIIVSSATPLLLASGWRRADEVQVGDRVAAARTIKDVARFGNGWGGEAFSELYGILLADGGLSSRNPTITKFDPEEFQHIVDLLEEVGNPYTAYPKSSNKKPFIRLLVGPVVDSLDIDGLIGQTSGGKFIPRWVFEESTWEETLAFLRGLWRCDGSVRHRDGQHDLWDVVYASTSERLARQVRELLLKIGIPSRIRPNNHAAYKDDPYKDQYLVRVETIEGVRHFLELVWGDHETASTLREFGDSNRDTYPKELVTPLIKEVCASLGLGLRRGRGHKSILKERGLRVTPLHPLSRAKLKRYVDLFDDLGALCPEHDQLKQMLNGDVIWDEIVSTESLGEQNVYHIEVERNHNYLHDGLVTHNSTLLGNKSIAYSGINLAFKTLYVSSTATQAQVFSVDRIKEPIDISPELSFMLDSRLSQNVLFKQFKNRSQIRIRYAYLNADRTRGIPADHILIDEIQDIIYENIPVIEQCASHSPWRLLTYSGTPKTLDNTIELFWNKFSTQNEWVVPCEACGSAKDKSTWHWNVLGMKNIGKDYLVCARCKRQINPMHPDAQWASLNPVTAENVHKVTFEGYRIPQLMVPWVLWSDIIMNLERYDTARFHNEVLAGPSPGRKSRRAAAKTSTSTRS
jgi:intein/homing endonuclease